MSRGGGTPAVEQSSLRGKLADAWVAELVYACDSKSHESNLVWVRLPPQAYKNGFITRF